MVNQNAVIEINAYDSVNESVRKMVWDELITYNDEFSVRNQMDYSITAEIGNEVIAAAIGETKYDWLIIQYFIVKPEFRNNKIG